MNRVRRIFRLKYVIPAVIVLIILGRLALHYAAELTIKGAFYDALGMGGAYATRWHTTVLLGGLGVGLALVLSLPVLFLRGRPQPIVVDPDAAPLGDPRDPRGDALMHRFPGLGRRADALARDPAGRMVRLAIIVAWLITFVILTAALAPTLASSRDQLLAWRNRSDFGVTDPIFGLDVGFYVFAEPALASLARLATIGLTLATIAIVVTGLGLSLVERQRLGRGAAAGVTSRTTTFGFAFGGLLLLS
ncbi:MAG TPA: UPF0182 family protein, partial [Gemmatimonadaceae bacterium]|nr:UPF0182 family protein [Gemmatimonadaceae bacterium]